MTSSLVARLTVRYSFMVCPRPPVWLLPLALPAAALANNGLNLSGYGAVSEAMGGADVALSHDTFAINTNPAGLAGTRGSRLDLYGAPFYTSNTHSDSVGNRQEQGDASAGGWVAGGYARRFSDSDLTASVALFVQGGAGFEYDQLNTVFSNLGLAPRDDISSTFSIVKLASGIAWQANDRWSFGASLGVNYASARQKFLTNTSTPSFQGFRLDGANGTALSGRFGVQYQPTERLTLGASYGTRSDIPLKGGTLSVNYTAIGAGTVRYRTAALQGFRLPQDAAVGLAFRPTRRWLVSLQYKWYDWSIVRDFTLDASNPQSSQTGVAPAIKLVTPISLNDQHVASIGIAYDFSDTTTFLTGINYARRPLPDENLNPVLALIQAPHLMLGARHSWSSSWEFVAAAELLPKQSATNPTINPIFGRSMTETQTGVVLHFMTTRRW